MNTPTIIGLGQYSRTGKDTFANALIASVKELHPSFKIARKSFASKLKDVTHQLYGWAGLQDEDYYNDLEHEHERDVVLPALGMTPVELWVRFGTPAVRAQVYDRTWIDYLLKADSGLDVIVIPDVRFPNEVQAIREHGGYLIKVVRPGYGPRSTVADLALVYYTGWDSVIGESGGIPGLRKWASKFASHIVQGLDLRLLNRAPDGIQRALAVQHLPTDEEIRRVFEEAGQACNDPKTEVATDA